MLNICCSNSCHTKRFDMLWVWVGVSCVFSCGTPHSILLYDVSHKTVQEKRKLLSKIGFFFVFTVVGILRSPCSARWHFRWICSVVVLVVLYLSFSGGMSPLSVIFCFVLFIKTFRDYVSAVKHVTIYAVFQVLFVNSEWLHTSHDSVCTLLTLMVFFFSLFKCLLFIRILFMFRSFFCAQVKKSANCLK